jgi:tRNA threonylcarbamoyladenosine biosynthesis protein TsaB
MLVISFKTDSPSAKIGLHKDNQTIDSVEWESQGNLADLIHEKLKNLLKNSNTELSSLEGIIVYRGPGSFTGLRISISVANALAYSLSVPIVGTDGDKWLEQGLRMLLAGKDSKIVLPEYGGEVKTTPPKK